MAYDVTKPIYSEGFRHVCKICKQPFTSWNRAVFRCPGCQLLGKMQAHVNVEENAPQETTAAVLALIQHVYNTMDVKP